MKFNNSQLQAIQHVNGPMMVLAGPGSGKTAVIVQRIDFLIRNCHIPPSSILTITFTKAAAAEMASRFHSVSAVSGQEPVFGTFHSIFYKILKNSRKMDFNIISEKQRFEFLRSLCCKYHLDAADSEEHLARLANEISRFKNNSENDVTFQTSILPPEQFENFRLAYQNLLYKNRCMDYDDILLNTMDLISNDEKILEAIRKQFRFIQIDEFQDINFCQYEIIKKIAAADNNLFVVGDDDQCIYRFRGSSSRTITSFQKDYPDHKMIFLNMNYRCCPEILSPAVQFIQTNSSHIEKNLKSSRENSESSYFRILKYEDPEEECKDIARRIQA